jgi:hypothetical protein
MASSHALPQRPKIYVDGSAAGHGIAELIAAGLTGVADVTTLCASVSDASRTFDLAVFVLDADPRVGLLLRLGVFLGAIGRERVVLLRPAVGAAELPEELRDMIVVPFTHACDGNVQTAIASACASIEEHVQRFTTPVGLAAPSTPSPDGDAGMVARRVRRALGTACSARSGQTLRIVDISMTGALLETYGEIPEHQLLDLELSLETGGSIRVTAKVVRIQYPQWGRVGGVGVAFTRFEGNSQAELERYLEATTAAV